MPEDHTDMRPECQVTFKSIGRTLDEIKTDLKKLIWSFIGMLITVVGGLLMALILQVINGKS